MYEIIHFPFEEIKRCESESQSIAFMKKWLLRHSDKYKMYAMEMYHGTACNLPILEKGLLPTSQTRRRSYQSTSGYVYLATTPEHAELFGRCGNGSRVAVYKVSVLIRNLKADLDQLSNIRLARSDMPDFITHCAVGSSLAESLVIARTARIKGSVQPYFIQQIY